MNTPDFVVRFKISNEDAFAFLEKAEGVIERYYQGEKVFCDYSTDKLLDICHHISDIVVKIRTSVIIDANVRKRTFKACARLVSIGFKHNYGFGCQALIEIKQHWHILFDFIHQRQNQHEDRGRQRYCGQCKNTIKKCDECSQAWGFYVQDEDYGGHYCQICWVRYYERDVPSSDDDTDEDVSQTDSDDRSSSDDGSSSDHGTDEDVSQIDSDDRSSSDDGTDDDVSQIDSDDRSSSDHGTDEDVSYTAPEPVSDPDDPY